MFRFVNFMNLVNLILGAPLTMGGKMFNPLRLSANPSEWCIFNFKLVSECLKCLGFLIWTCQSPQWYFFLLAQGLRLFMFTCCWLLWDDAMSTGQRWCQYWWEQTRTSFFPLCQAVCTNTTNMSPPYTFTANIGTPVHFECHSRFNIKLEAFIKRIN